MEATGIMTEADFGDPRIDEGIRLFNEGEYFACHDVFEDYWGELVCPEKPFFQGLIQAAVALYHFEERNLGGARKMYFSASTYLRSFAPECARIDVSSLLQQMDACFAELAQPHREYPAHIVMDTSLRPRISRREQG
ncbi:MAG: DUF309 domain-containing protein [Planctomycetaceae bacterium]|nr:DUF309 domain-containing protein [Planctomycetaceae bacterium]